MWRGPEGLQLICIPLGSKTQSLKRKGDLMSPDPDGQWPSSLIRVTSGYRQAQELEQKKAEERLAEQLHQEFGRQPTWSELQVYLGTRERERREHERAARLAQLEGEQAEFLRKGLNLIGGGGGPLPDPPRSSGGGRSPRQPVELMVAAQQRGLSRSQMLRLVTTGRVAGQKVGGKWYVSG